MQIFTVVYNHIDKHGCDIEEVKALRSYKSREAAQAAIEAERADYFDGQGTFEWEGDVAVLGESVLFRIIETELN